MGWRRFIRWAVLSVLLWAQGPLFSQGNGNTPSSREEKQLAYFLGETEKATAEFEKTSQEVEARISDLVTALSADEPDLNIAPLCNAFLDAEMKRSHDLLNASSFLYSAEQLILNPKSTIPSIEKSIAKRQIKSILTRLEERMSKSYKALEKEAKKWLKRHPQELPFNVKQTLRAMVARSSFFINILVILIIHFSIH